MQDYYAARANEYDRIYQKPERQADLRLIEAWLPHRLADRSVLEIACGTGYWTGFYAARATRVLGIDTAQQTLDIARARVPSRHVAFRIGDAYDLPVETPRFDAAFAGFWWSHVPVSRLPEFLRGLDAALAPGSTVVFIDNRYVAGSNTPLCGRDSDGNTFQTRLLDDGSSHRILKNFPAREELLEVVAPLADAPRVHEWRYYWALEYRTRMR